MPTKSGFTLVELLVVVSLITILSVTGLVLFQSARGKATEAKYRGDIDAIKKAYEKNFDPSLNNGQGGYKVLSTSDFAGGKIPTPDGTTNTSYNFVYAPASSPAPAFKVCSSLNSQTACSSPSTNCHCVTSIQGDNTIIQTLNSTNHPATCDPNGTLNTGLVGYWNMNETPTWVTGSVVADISGTNNSGQVQGGAVNNASGPTSSFNQAGSFNGSTAYITVGDKLDMGTNNFSLTGWINKGTSTNNDKYQDWIIGKKATTGVDVNLLPGYTLEVDGSRFPTRTGSLSFLIYDGTGGTGVVTPERVDDGIWHFVAAVVDRTNRKISLYIDGTKSVEVDIQPELGSADNNANLMIANVEWNPTSKFNGLLDDIRVYNRVLSASEISSLYYGGTGCVP